VRPKDAYLELAREFRLSNDALRQVVPSNGAKLWENRVQWARQRLVNEGSLDGSVRGEWRLSVPASSS
jgi:restriction endonuclease Mrr